MGESHAKAQSAKGKNANKNSQPARQREFEPKRTKPRAFAEPTVFCRVFLRFAPWREILLPPARPWASGIRRISREGERQRGRHANRETIDRMIAPSSSEPGPSQAQQTACNRHETDQSPHAVDPTSLGPPIAGNDKRCPGRQHQQANAKCPFGHFFEAAKKAPMLFGGEPQTADNHDEHRHGTRQQEQRAQGGRGARARRSKNAGAMLKRLTSSKSSEFHKIRLQYCASIHGQSAGR